MKYAGMMLVTKCSKTSSRKNAASSTTTTPLTVRPRWRSARTMSGTPNSRMIEPLPNRASSNDSLKATATPESRSQRFSFSQTMDRAALRVGAKYRFSVLGSSAACTSSIMDMCVLPD